MIVFILLLARLGFTYLLSCDNLEQVTDKQWCNGVFDCSDNSDEKPSCCRAGYQRGTSGRCEDIDECSRAGSLVCSQHCHNTEGSYNCTCDHGFDLRPNSDLHNNDSRRTYCKALGDDPLFLVSVNNRLLQSTDLYNFDPVPMSGSSTDTYFNQTHIYDFDYDYKNRLVFWCSDDFGSSMHKTVWKGRFQNSELYDIEKVAEQVDCVSISVDWVNEKIYWANSGQLAVSSYDGSNQSILLWRNFWSFRAVAVSPSTGYIFWSDCGTDAHIGRANMDGEQKMFLIKESEGDLIMAPTAMTIDHHAGHLYWIDAHYKTLHVMDFEGNSFPLVQESNNMVSAWRMVVFEDRVYWVDSRMTEGTVPMHSASKLTGLSYQKNILNMAAEITGFRLHHALVQPPHANACDHNECEHLCLLTPTGFECKCDNGYMLIGDNKSCQMLDLTCTERSCDPRYCIMCGDGACLRSYLRCDGDADCYDGSDEDNCLSTLGGLRRNCESREFSCSNGYQCVAERVVCDGSADCVDGSDEEERVCSGSQCRREDFLCDSSVCLTRDRICDDISDCRDGTDEVNCDGPRCKDTQFTCTTSRACLDISRRCDNVPDCDDRSDEWGCPTVCRETEFSCDNGRTCVALSSRCDEAPDCVDGTDELNCDKTPLCAEGHSKCSASSRECIADSRFCNGVPDCPGGSDEVGCECKKQPGMVPCSNGEGCVTKAQWCDGVDHCTNGADEREDCCPYGYSREYEFSECQDDDECLRQDGVCSQHCNNTLGGYTCSCDSGYKLVNTTKQSGFITTESFCRAEGEMDIVITVRNDFPSKLKVPESTADTVDYESSRIAGNFVPIELSGDFKYSEYLMADFDFDIRARKLFWCSTQHYYGPATYERAIWVADFDENLENIRNSRIILDHINCDSMSVDWVNKLVYFTSDTNSIDVVDYEGKYRRAIIWTGLSAPRAIEVDPDQGLLFYTDWGHTAHLGRANMDGSGRKILINNNNTQQPQIKWPNALTIDHPNKNLYWMDASMKSIECMKYDGSARYTISSRDDSLGSPWRMRVFQDTVFWREKEGKIKSANKFTGDQFSTVRVISPSGEQLAGGNGLRIFHPVVQPMSTPRCSPESCGSLCLPVPNGYRCACPTGKFLLQDNFTCTAQIDGYAFVVLKEMITKVALEPLEPVLQAITFQGNKYVEGTYWSIDCHQEWVYFNSISNNISEVSINRMYHNGEERQVIINEKSDGGLSIDWINDKLYWASRETVSVGEIDGSEHTTLFQMEGFNIRDILVDPCKGYIYLSVLNRGIYRSSMDGNVDSLIQIMEFTEQMEFPTIGLSFDRDTNSLFFANQNVIYKVRIRKSGSPVLETVITREEGINIRALDIWGRDKIIWTEAYPPKSRDMTRSYRQEHNPVRIVTMPKLGISADTQVQIIREDITRAISGIKVWPKRDSVCPDSGELNPCEKHHCSHMCVQSRAQNAPSPEPKTQKEHRCVCPTGYALKANSSTKCADEISKYIVYNTSGIQTVSLDTNFLTPIKEPPNMSFNIKSFAIDAKKNLVYYCYGDPNKFEVRGLFNETGHVTVLPIHTLACTGMAVEWITNKLYVVDGRSGVILVVDLDRPYLIKYIVKDLNNPKNIVVHPIQGKIYWILESNSIMSTNMEGTDVIETIVSYNTPTDTGRKVTSLQQMYIDYKANDLYWTENAAQSQVGFIGSIKRVNLGLPTKIVETVLEVLHQPLAGVTMINDLIYYTDLQDGRLHQRTGPKNGTFLLTTAPESFLLSSQSQPALLDSPCTVNNGDCSDFCLLDPMVGYKCSCPTGVQLTDSLTCDTPHNKSLVVANSTRISIISLRTNEPGIDRVLTSKPRNLKSIDVDIRENKIYWSEVNIDGGSIWMFDMHSGNVEKIADKNMRIPNSIAVDWNSQNLYWIDSSPEGKGTLEVMSLRYKNARSVLKTYEGDSKSKKPHQIVLDPNEKLLFVSYPVPVKEVITRMWLDGSNPFHIIPSDADVPTQRGAQVVSSLAIDLIDQRLYWASNDNMNHISACDYSGKARDIINGLRSGIGDPRITSISILNRNVFLQDFNYLSNIQVEEYPEYMKDTSGIETRPSNKYSFKHMKGSIVSMKVNSVAVLKGADIMCPPDKCVNQICIPSYIEAYCRCGDGDVQCQKDSEQKVEVVTNILPGNTLPCPDNFCNDHGTCIQTTAHNSSNFCECDAGWDPPRCVKQAQGIIKSALYYALPSVLVVILIVVVILWRQPHNRLCPTLCPTLCPALCPTYKEALGDNSSDGDNTDSQRDPEAKKLAAIGGTARLGRSYLQPKKNSAEEFV